MSDDFLEQRVQDLAEAFHRAGYRLFRVGGSVRDRLLGRPVHDLDLTTDATPDEIKRLARRAKPDAVYDVGARFGTIGMVFRRPGGHPSDGHPSDGSRPDGHHPGAHAGQPAATVEAGLGGSGLGGAPTDGEAAAGGADGGAEQVEITTFRTEAYPDGTRKPVVAFGTSLEDDLARRDFTMNAMAQDLRTGEVFDPFGGERDLRQETIRAVGDPAARFDEDPLRMLRAVRFAAQLGFAVDGETQAAIRAGASSLERISRERIAEELNRILVSPRPALGLRLATELGLMDDALPELLPMRGVSQRPLHHKDVFEHTMGVVENIPPALLLRWAALLHDIGKPRTKSVQDGEVHFFGHEDVGERMARQILRRLHFDGRFVERVARLVRMHLRVNSYDSEWTDAAVRRLMREAGDDLDDLIHLSRADVTSYRQERVLAANLRADEFARRCQTLLAQEDVARLHSPLDGNDLMTLFGKSPGPWIRPIKDYLLDLVLDGKLDQDDRQAGAELARRYAAEQGLE